MLFFLLYDDYWTNDNEMAAQVMKEKRNIIKIPITESKLIAFQIITSMHERREMIK